MSTTTLEEVGLRAVSPPIRSRMWADARDEFLFFLKHRLGLQRCYEDSEALTLGSWMHTCIRLELDPPPQTTFESCLTARLAELKRNLEVGGFGTEAISTFLTEETRLANLARAWVPAALDVPIPNNKWLSRGLRAFLKQPHWKILCWEREFPFQYEWMEDDCRIQYPVIIQPDCLVLNTQTNEVWCLDFKSCDESPSQRLLTCPFEFQNRLYSHFLSRSLHLIRDQIGAHSGFNWASLEDKPLRWGGFMHIALQKPKLRPSSEDCDYTWVSKGVKTGRSMRVTPTQDDKGVAGGCGWMTETGEQMSVMLYPSLEDTLRYMHDLTGKKPEKEVIQPPSMDRYARRCRRWYHAQEEFTHLAEQWHVEPPVNISFTSLDWKDERLYAEFSRQMNFLTELATRPPDPALFTRSSIGMTNRNGGVNVYAPLYAAPIHDWPFQIKQARLITPHLLETPNV